MDGPLFKFQNPSWLFIKLDEIHPVVGHEKKIGNIKLKLCFLMSGWIEWIDKSDLLKIVYFNFWMKIKKNSCPTYQLILSFWILNCVLSIQILNAKCNKWAIKFAIKLPKLELAKLFSGF